MNNMLAKKFDFGSLVTFAMPNVLMMIMLSMYIIVDGIFISNVLGTTALSAANMVYPAISFEMALAIMLATGGSAIIARKMGEGKHREARENFSFIVVVELLIGLAVAVLGNVFIGHIIGFLGASDLQFATCVTYARILFTFAPCFFLQTAFQTFFVTAGKPVWGLVLTVSSGIVNIILDYVFMVPLNMGIAGAALATGVGYSIPAAAGLLFFCVSKTNPLHFVKPKTDWKALFNASTNGSSEMVTNLANAATTFLFNYTFLTYYGEEGVASITIILYFQYIFTALYFGYSNGIAPIISFKHGSNDRAQLQTIFKSSVLFLLVCSAVANLVIHLAIEPLITIFTSRESSVYRITADGFKLYSIAFVIMGVGIFASALFTAFSDGKTSAIISFSRTFVFIIGSILILPALIGETGVWLAVPLAEVLGFGVSLLYMVSKRKIFGYFGGQTCKNHV